MGRFINAKTYLPLTFKIYNFYLRKKEEKGKDFLEPNSSPPPSKSRTASSITKNIRDQ
jgi:hypothetical protein